MYLNSGIRQSHSSMPEYYDCMYSELRLGSLYTRSIAYNNAQIKLSILIIITLNTLIMKYKSKVIKIIIYCRFKTNFLVNVNLRPIFQFNRKLGRALSMQSNPYLA